MADDPVIITPEQEAAITKQIEGLRARLKALRDEFAQKAGYQEYAARLGEIATEQGKLNLQVKNLLDPLPLATRSLLSAAESGESLQRSLRGTMFQSMGLGDAVGKLEKAFHGIGTDGANLKETILGIGSAAFFLGTNLGRALITPFGDADKVVASLSPTLANINNLMREYHKAQDLVNVGYLDLGKSMEDFRGRGDLVIDAVQKTTAQFFISGQEQQKFIQMVRAIPGALDAATASAEVAGKEMTQMAQFLLVARGAGMDTTQAANFLTKSFMQFGADMPKALEALAKFKTAADEGGTSTSIASEQITTASSGFTMFSTRLADANNVWLTFQKSLKDQVGPQAIGELTGSAARGLAGMSLNTQALVAQMSGMTRGVSALGGALRMELDMRQEGGLAKNLERVQQTISRLGGGRIVTLEQAVQNPAQEMQFQLQRQLAGQMLGVQGGPQQSRLLEVLQNVEKGGVATAQANKEVQTLMEDGQKAQAASVTAMDKTAMGLGRTNASLLRLVEIEKSAEQHLAHIGRAFGARGVGKQLGEDDVARATRAALTAGRAAATAAGPAMRGLGREALTFGSGVGRGLRGEERESMFRARRRVPEMAPIEPRRPGERLLATPFRPAEARPFLPSPSRPTEARPILPFFSRRMDQEPMPPAARGGVRESGRRGATEAEYRAEVLPQEITVKIVCEKCLEKKMRQIMAKGIRANRGDDHTND